MREHYQLAKTRYDTNRSSLDTSLRASQVEVDTATEQLKAIASAATTDPYMSQEAADSPMETADEAQDAAAQQDHPEGPTGDLPADPMRHGQFSSSSQGSVEHPQGQPPMPTFEVPADTMYRKASPSRSPTRPTPYTQPQELTHPPGEDPIPMDEFQQQILEAQQAAAAAGVSGEAASQGPAGQRSPTEPATEAPSGTAGPQEQTQSQGMEPATSQVFP